MNSPANKHECTVVEPRIFSSGYVLSALALALLGMAVLSPRAAGAGLDNLSFGPGVPDCNENGRADAEDIACGGGNECDGLPGSFDCNDNGIPDECDVMGLGGFGTVLSANTTGANDGAFLGAPDDTYVGIGGQMVEYDFSNSPIVDTDGTDFNIYELDFGVVESDVIDVLVSDDGAVFHSLRGMGQPLVRIPGDEVHSDDDYARSYDLSDVGLTEASFIRIVGDRDAPSGGNSGFDLDAVGAMHQLPAGDCNHNGVPDECEVDPCSSPQPPAGPGSQSDSDDDGVLDSRDDCPGTASGAQVDDAGCSCTLLDCDDDNPCTDDTCNEAAGCVHTPDDANPCGDGDVCNGSETCNDGTCEDGTPLDCADAEPCTDDSCDPAAGCVFTPNDGSTCDDGDVCTDDTCLDGACESTPVDCAPDQTCIGGDCIPLWELQVDRLNASDPAGVPVPVIPVRSHLDGEEVTIPVPEPAEENMLFLRWEGDVPAGQETADPLVLVMDADKTVTAVFQVIECVEDADCDDGLFCNGAEGCVDDACVDGAAPCTDDQVCNEETGACDATGEGEGEGGGGGGGGTGAGPCGAFGCTPGGPAIILTLLGLCVFRFAGPGRSRRM